MLGGAGRRGIVLDGDRQSRRLRDVARDVEIPPRLHRVARRVDRVEPVPEFEWRRDADPGDPALLARVQVGHQMGMALGKKIHDRRWRRVGVVPLALHAQPPGHVDQHQVGALAADVEAEGQYSVGIERHRDRRLADLAADRRATDQQPVLLERADDDRDGLRRQVGPPRNLGAGQATMPLDQ